VELILKNMTMALSIVAAGAIPGTLYAQSLLPVPDSAMTIRSYAGTGLNLRNMLYAASWSGIGATNTNNNNFLKSTGSYKLNLSSGNLINSLGLKTEAFSATNALNPNNFRRGNVLPREVLLDGQHFTLGASYNYGLNNMLRGGAGGMNGRNPGLSLHAGISF
jgi:hypothetical protein